MKNLLKKIIRWAFSKYVVVYQQEKFLSDVEIIQSKDRVIKYEREEMALRLAHKMLEDKAITFQLEKDVQRMGNRMRAKVYVLKV